LLLFVSYESSLSEIPMDDIESRTQRNGIKYYFNCITGCSAVEKEDFGKS
jgi:hypothetical protein